MLPGVSRLSAWVHFRSSVGCPTTVTAVEEGHPTFAELADTIQAAINLWGQGNRVAATGYLDQAIGAATECGNAEVVDRLNRFRVEIASGANPDPYHGWGPSHRDC
jgi:hypothetical protein